jgi:hypothetical protein
MNFGRAIDIERGRLSQLPIGINFRAAQTEGTLNVL